MGTTTMLPDGISTTDVEPNDVNDDAEALHFETDEETAIAIGESAGNQMYVEAKQFVAMSVDGTQEVGPMEAMQAGITPDDDRVVGQNEEEGVLEIEVDEASIFVSNDEGEVGGGVKTVEGADIDTAIEQFADEDL